MTGRHESPPEGSAAREATASPYVGRHESVQYRCDRCFMPAILVGGQWQHAEAADAAFCLLVMRGH